MKFAVADDARVMRAAIRTVAAGGGHEIAGEAEDSEAAYQLFARERPDVMVIDSRLPPAGALPLIARVREAFPEAKLLVIASVRETPLVREAVARGASGALRRPLDPAEMLATLERVRGA